MLRKTLVLFSIVMLVSAVTVFACGDNTKSAAVDKASAGEYACGSTEKAAVKTGDSACPYMKANESGTHECTTECAAGCVSSSRCTKAAETVKSDAEEKKKAINIDETVMNEEKSRSEKL